MISPFTGGRVRYVKQTNEFMFRGHLFTITSRVYECVDTGQRFHTSQQAQTTLDNLFMQYEAKFGKLDPPFGEKNINIKNKK